MKKVTIIGAGSVGSTIAYTLTVMGAASEIVMIDINTEKALGEALDIRQGTPFCNTCSVYAGSYADAAGSDIVIITSGIARKPGQTRLELAQTNVNILRSIIPGITRYAPDSTYMIVANPVDIMTYAFTKFSGIPEDRILGSGTILDTARLRARLSEYYNINHQNVHAYVLGEHGDSSFVPWSVANVSNVPLAEFCASVRKDNALYPELKFDEVEDYVRKSGSVVIKRKGLTCYAVSMAVCNLCKCMFYSVDSSVTVSTMMHGEYGIDNVALSILNMVGNGKVHGKVLMPLNDDELASLRKSADSLKAVINGLNL